MEQSEIQKFYKDCNVFITGGTGFMGKVLIEKLLRSTEVTTVFVLVREKKGRNAYMRIEELFDDVLFDKLKVEQPKFRNRVEAIPGDISMAGLGLSITDREKIWSNIHVVFHVAATVNFDEHIKLSYNINVSGTRDMIELGKQMTNLKAMIHVSTAFSNCHLEEIEEKFYDGILNHDKVGELLEKMSTEEAELCTPKILGTWPNTYTFTKALGESVIKDMGGGLPIGIFRPGIVISTYREPIQGWIDNLYGPTGLVAGVISGVIRTILCDKRSVADLVPVDTCVAGLIASAWHVSSKNNERIPTNIPIYNYVSSPENPITWAEFVELNKIHGAEFPLLNSIWSVHVLCTANLRLFAFFRVILHIFPALFIDLGLVLSGQKPRLLKTYKRIHKLEDVLSYFSLRSWRFSNKNTISMWKSLNRTDQELFPFSMTTVQWLVYYRRYIKGARVYLLKDPESTLSNAKLRDQRFNTLNTFFMVLVIFCACNVVSSMFSKLFVSLF